MTKKLQLVLFLSIVLTIICPIFGVFPLWFSLKALTMKDNQEEATIQINTASKLLKILTILMVVLYIAVIAFMIFLMHE